MPDTFEAYLEINDPDTNLTIQNVVHTQYIDEDGILYLCSNAYEGDWEGGPITMINISDYITTYNGT